MYSSSQPPFPKIRGQEAPPVKGGQPLAAYRQRQIYLTKSPAFCQFPPGGPLALPLGELSAQLTERALQSPAAHPLSVFAPLSHLSQRERQAHAVPPPLQGEAFFSPLQTTFSRDTIGAKGAIG